MKVITLAPFFLAAAIAVGSAGLTTIFLLRSAHTEASRATSEVALSPDEIGVAELRAELQALRGENQALQTRLTALELRAPTNERSAVGDYASVEDLKALEEQLLVLLGGTDLASVEPAALKTRVAYALDALREDEAAVRAQRSLEKQAARLEARVTKMSDWLGLDAYQTTEMRALLTQKDERDNELTRQWKAGGDLAVLGDQKRTNAATHRADLERVLTSSQLETLNERYNSKN